jgi:ferredoxin-NADP reductase
MSDVLTATVTDARFLSPHVREIVLSPEAPLDFVPGQWLSLRLPVGDRPPLIRAYSLALPPDNDGRLVLCFDRVEGGLGSEYLWQIEPGDAAKFSGPMGNFVVPDGRDNLLFVARYTGIVPFRAMLHHLANSGTERRVSLIYAAPSEEERVYGDEMAALAECSPWFTYVPVKGYGEDLVMDAVREAGDALAPFAPMVCGVREFTLPLRQFLMETHGFDRRAVKLENYTGPAR